MRKSSLLIGLVLLVSIGAGYSSFHDLESSSNSFQAGRVDLELGWEESYNGVSIENQSLTDGPGPVFNLTGIQPGDEGSASIELNGKGNPSWLWMRINQTENSEINISDGEDEEAVYRTGYKVIDSFEDGNLDEYTGDRGEFEIQNNVARDGNALVSGGKRVQISSSSGLPAYPEAGDNITYYTMSTADEYSNNFSRSWFKFGYQDEDNFYKIMINFNYRDDWYLYKMENGHFTQLDSDGNVDGDFSENWSRVRIEWGEDGDITAKLYDADGDQVKSTLTANDESFKDGGIALKTRNDLDSQRVYFDNITLETREQVESGDRGELEDLLMFKLWYDDNGNGAQDHDEELIFNGTAGQLDGNFSQATLLNGSRSGFIDGNHGKLGIKWWLPYGDVCEAQTDTKKFDFSFLSQQTRHNSNPVYSPGALFHDAEESEGNTFSTGSFESCDGECGPVRSPGATYTASRETANGVGDISYAVVQDESTRIKFEDAPQGLGENGYAQTDTFNVTVENSHDTVYVRTKAGQSEGSVKLVGEGDIKTVTEGMFTVKLERITRNSDGSKTYTISVTSDEREDTPALSHIVFEFCEDFKEEGRFYQVDFVGGKPIEELAWDSTYHGQGRMINYLHGSTEDPVTARGRADMVECVESFEPVQVDTAKHQAAVEFRVDSQKGCEVSLVSYEKASCGPPYFTLPQYMYDSVTRSWKKGKHTLKVDLPH